MMRILRTIVITGAAAVGLVAVSGAETGLGGNRPPVASVRSPVDGSFFVVGRAVSLLASATDAEEPAATLQYRWTVDLVRPDGVEPEFFMASEPSAFFTVEDLEEEAGASLSIRLIVTDSGGLSDTVAVKAYPKIGHEPTYPIGPGDIVDVCYYAGGEKQEQFSAEVSTNGTITSPLVGETSVGGLTAAEISARLTAILAQDFFVNPQVLVNVRQNPKKIFVGGEVKQPGAYSIRDGSTLVNACILAGGFTDFAALNRVTVTRTVGKQTKIIKIDLRDVQKGKASDLALETGDRIDVPHRMF